MFPPLSDKTVTSKAWIKRDVSHTLKARLTAGVTPHRKKRPNRWREHESVRDTLALSHSSDVMKRRSALKHLLHAQLHLLHLLVTVLVPLWVFSLCTPATSASWPLSVQWVAAVPLWCYLTCTNTTVCFISLCWLSFTPMGHPSSRLTSGDIGQWEDPEAGAVTQNKPASRHFYPIALLLVSSHLLVVWLILSLVFLLAKYQ